MKQYYLLNGKIKKGVEWSIIAFIISFICRGGFASSEFLKEAYKDTIEIINENPVYGVSYATHIRWGIIFPDSLLFAALPAFLISFFFGYKISRGLNQERKEQLISWRNQTFGILITIPIFLIIAGIVIWATNGRSTNEDFLELIDLIRRMILLLPLYMFLSIPIFLLVSRKTKTDDI